MTVEEIEIIVTAKVEEAMKELEKIMPAIKQAMKQAQEAFSKVNTKEMQNKLNSAINFMKKKMQDFKKSSENNEIAIKVNNKEAEKQITQLEKEIDSLQKKITGRQMKLDIINPQIDEILDKTKKEVTPEGVSPNDKALDKVINSRLDSNKDFKSLSSQADKLYTEIDAYNKQLNIAKSKMAQLKQAISNTATTQNKLGSFFSAFKQKVDQVKPSILNMKENFNGLPKITQNITNHIKNMQTGLKNGLGTILKYVGALFSLQTIYSTLSSSASSWLSSQNALSQQLSANIDYMKYALGSSLAPIIQYLISLVYQLMKAIQSVVYALTGVNIFAKASANSFKSAQKSAKDTSKSLSSIHSEINNVGDKGSSGSGATSPNIDMSNIDSAMNPLSQKLYDFFKPLFDSWNKYGTQVISALKNAFNGVGQAISAMWSSIETLFTNGTIYSIIENLLNSIGQIGNAWANAWNNDNNGTEIIQGIADMINDITEAILDLVSSTGFQSFLDGVVSAFNGLVQLLEPVVTGFSEMAEKILEIVFSTIGDVLTAIGNALQTISQNETAVEILKAVGEAIAIIVGSMILVNGLIAIFTALTAPITLIILAVIAAITSIILVIKNWGTISEWFQDLWVKITDKLQEIWNNIKTFFVNLWNSIIDKIKAVWNGIKDFLSNLWNGILNIVRTIWNAVKTTISSVINGIKITITNVLNGIKTVWNNIWTTIGNIVNNVWNGIWSGIKTVINFILGGIESFVNGTIKGINKLLSGISKVANAVGSLIGLKPISLQISTISLPRLAKGGVLTEATAVVAGEYSGAKSNPEIVTPQNLMRETFEDVFSDFNSSKGQPIHVTIQYLGKEIFNDTIDYINSKTRRTGRNTIVTVEK